MAVLAVLCIIASSVDAKAITNSQEEQSKEAEEVLKVGITIFRERHTLYQCSVLPTLIVKDLPKYQAFNDFADTANMEYAVRVT